MRVAAALAVALALGACAGTPPPVDLSGAWPARAGDYDDVTAAWTRRAVLRGHFQQTLEVIATFRAPPWQAAAAARSARARGSSPEAALEAARAAEATADYELALVVTTYDRAENDLDRGERSIWKLALVDASGVETPPSSVVRDRRPPEVLRAELPEVGDFAEVYLVRFPRAAAALGPGVPSVTLRMWSSRGAVSMVWKAR